MARPRIAVLISGRGSNLQALIAATRSGRLDAEVAQVVSSSANAPGLARAREAGLETAVLEHRAYATREAYDAALAARVRETPSDLVCLAGFMRKLGPGFCRAFPEAVLNIHPSLLPAFPGLDAPRQALEHGVKVTGATAHFVTEELDAGPIVLQQSVPVVDDDTCETLADRILALEHRLYPEAVQRILHTPWRIVGRRVVFGATPETLR